MPRIEVKSGFIHYYGNPAGYVENGRAVVDTIFTSDELTEFLSEQKGLEVEWRDGVFDRLTRVSPTGDDACDRKRLKDCRIWQLKPGVDPTIRYISYSDLKAMDGSPEPEPANYRLVFDGQIETNDLDAIYTKFDTTPPLWGSNGDTIAISDIIELYDGTGSEFHYINKKGFSEISFRPQQSETHDMGMSINRPYGT